MILCRMDPDRWTASRKVQKSLYDLEEASHHELHSCKEMKSANNHMSLEEDPKPQLRPQSHRLDYSPGRPWEEGLVRLELDRCPMVTVRWHIRVVLSCWICDSLLYRIRKWAQPHAKDHNPKLSRPAKTGTKHCAASEESSLGGRRGVVSWGQQLRCTSWDFGATVEQPLKPKSLPLLASVSHMLWQSSPTRDEGSLECVTLAHVYLCINQGLFNNAI